MCVCLHLHSIYSICRRLLLFCVIILKTNTMYFPFFFCFLTNRCRQSLVFNSRSFLSRDVLHILRLIGAEKLIEDHSSFL